MKLLVQILPTHPACRVSRLFLSSLTALCACTDLADSGSRTLARCLDDRQDSVNNAARLRGCMMCGNVPSLRALRSPPKVPKEIYTSCLCSQFIFTSHHSAGTAPKAFGFQIWKISTKSSCSLFSTDLLLAITYTMWVFIWLLTVNA